MLKEIICLFPLIYLFDDFTDCVHFGLTPIIHANQFTTSLAGQVVGGARMRTLQWLLSMYPLRPQPGRLVTSGIESEMFNLP